jgi:site-specific DNA-methyltransferase (adenine-specific)
VIAAEDFTLAPESAPAEPEPIAAAPGTLDLRHGDCMDLMREFPDKHFDLAIVDPPYGIGEGTRSRGMGTSCMSGDYALKSWDKAPPSAEYFHELRRVSRHQIVWGANYYPQHFTASMGWIFWDKMASGDFSDGELAFSSFDRGLRKFTFAWMGMRQGNMAEKEDRIHPTQKPVALYRWLLENYAKPGQRILDTHLGSGSHAIACHYFGAHLTASELDADYYAAACARIARETAQTTLFPA